MISEESCNTEDWSNDAENSVCTTGINYILIYYNRQLFVKNLNISQYYCIYYFMEINVAFFQKHKIFWRVVKDNIECNKVF